MPCTHPILVMEWHDEFAAYCACLLCHSRVEVSTGSLEAAYEGFESTDPPSWDQPERTALLVKRSSLL